MILSCLPGSCQVNLVVKQDEGGEQDEKDERKNKKKYGEQVLHHDHDKIVMPILRTMTIVMIRVQDNNNNHNKKTIKNNSIDMKKTIKSKQKQNKTETD